MNMLYGVYSCVCVCVCVSAVGVYVWVLVCSLSSIHFHVDECVLSGRGYVSLLFQGKGNCPCVFLGKGQSFTHHLTHAFADIIVAYCGLCSNELVGCTSCPLSLSLSLSLSLPLSLSL